MLKSPEIISRVEIFTLREAAITLGRFPEAAIKTGGISHATAYDLGSDSVLFEFFDDQNLSDFPKFEVTHSVLTNAGEGFAAHDVRSFNFAYARPLFRPWRSKYDLTYEETTTIEIDGETTPNPVIDYSLSDTRKGRKQEKRVEKELEMMRDMYGEHGLTYEKYENLTKAVGLCGVGSLVAVGKKAVR